MRDSQRVTLRPIGPCINFHFHQKWVEVPEDKDYFYQKREAEGDLAVEAMLPIDTTDPNDPATLLAWHFALSMFDPFQDSPSPSLFDEAINQMVEESMVEYISLPPLGA